jgi:hypothetical protein
MIVQDSTTGQLHEVPDFGMYAGDPNVYDGLGNPLGLGPLAALIPAAASALAPLASSVLPAVANALIPAAGATGQAIQSAMSIGNQLAPIAHQAASGFIRPFLAPPPAPTNVTVQQQAPMVGPPPFIRVPPPGAPRPMPHVPHAHTPRPPQAPPGWMRPPATPMAFKPRRYFMRCSAWPGPPGLVPSHAPGLIEPPGPAAPGLAPFRRTRARRRR